MATWKLLLEADQEEKKEEIETTWWKNLPPKGTENQIIWTGCLVEEGVVLS